MSRPSHSEHVLQQLNSQREWGFLCDCCIAIGDIYFRAHKAVLAACSSYFRMLFIQDQKGAAWFDLSNMQISAECFDLILQLMYLGGIVVDHYKVEELKASMTCLQMYYIPKSVEELNQTSQATPSSSSSSSSSAGKMMFGVRMFEQRKTKPPATPTRQDVPALRAPEEVATPPAADQPCDLRSLRPSSRIKERPRFGRTYTCDDCGFVFSCEKLLIEHILTCTNRKAFQKTSSASDGPEDTPLRSVSTGMVTIKVEPDEPDPEGVGEDEAGEAGEVGVAEEAESSPCELCGAPLTPEQQSAHYVSSHMGHICACGRCGQVLIKGRQLQEHAERCGEGAESPQPEAMDEEEEEEPLEADAPSLAPPQPDGAEEPFNRRRHFCTICGKGFYQRCHLREHFTVHSKKKQFSCPTCGKQFLRQRQLRLHTDMHKGVARYLCPVCQQGTFLKHDHMRHMISHLTAGQTICQVCFQICAGAEQLETHMDLHLYICGVCGDKFRLRKDMRNHYNSRHSRRPML